MSESGSSLYALYGLTVSSSFPLSRIEALTKVDARPDPDVRVSLGEAPERLNPVSAGGLWWETNPQEALLDVPKVGRIWVKPSEIIVDPVATASIQDLSFGVLAAAMPPLLFLRRTFVLHAAAVRWGNGAIAIGGTSGVGKSTTLFECIRRGGGFVTDDVCALDVVEPRTNIRIQPGPPGIRLWPDTLDHYALSPDSFEPVRPAALKRLVTSFVAQAAPTPLTAVVMLVPSTKAEIDCTPVSGGDAFNTVRSMLYGPRMMYAIDRGAAFRKVATIANQVPTFVLRRSDDVSSVERVADAILAATR